MAGTSIPSNSTSASSGSRSSGSSSSSSGRGGSTSGGSTTSGSTPSSAISFTLNGQPVSLTIADKSTPFVWALRDHLGMTGTKYGCGIEVCGACTILVNGEPEKSCDMSVSEAAGKTIMTIEGLSADPLGAKLQAAWIEKQVPQCGFCQSGMLMAAFGRLKSGSTKASVASSLRNICQCGTYQRVKEAILSLPGVP